MSLSQNCNKLSVSGNNDLHQERADVAFTSLRFQYYNKTDSVKSSKRLVSQQIKCPSYPCVGSIPAMDLRNYDNTETEGGVAQN